MKKIAIITFVDTYKNYQDDYDCDKIVDSITEWSEVTQEDYDILVKEEARSRNFFVIERLDADPKFIQKTVAEYLKQAKAEAEKKLKAEQAAKEKKLAAELKKRAKTEADEIELLRKLQEKHKDKVIKT